MKMTKKNSIVMRTPLSNCLKVRKEYLSNIMDKVIIVRGSYWHSFAFVYEGLRIQAVERRGY